jgi:hypothetical protein
MFIFGHSKGMKGKVLLGIWWTIRVIKMDVGREEEEDQRSMLAVPGEEGKCHLEIQRDWHERKNADLTASSSDGKTDRPASRYVLFQNFHN